MVVAVLTAVAACSRRCDLKSVRPKRGLFNPATVPVLSTEPTWLPPTAAVNGAKTFPQHRNCLLLGVLSLLLIFIVMFRLFNWLHPPQVERGRSVGKDRLLLLVTSWFSGKKMEGWLLLLLLPPSSLGAAPKREQGLESETQSQLCLLPTVWLDKLPNLSEPHIPLLTKMRVIPTFQDWCDDEMEYCQWKILAQGQTYKVATQLMLD